MNKRGVIAEKHLKSQWQLPGEETGNFYSTQFCPADSISCGRKAREKIGKKRKDEASMQPC